MYTIGEISKIVKISADTLRYYDGIGLLKPGHVKSGSRYRYYSDEQVEDLLFIMELKCYGFSLDHIRKLLTCKDAFLLKHAFELRLEELGLELTKIKDTMNILQRRIKVLERESEKLMSNGTVLIVDDLALARLLLKNILEKFGYRVIGEASNGVEACDRYFEMNPDLVIMDITMPLMDGIYATLKIREKDTDAKIIICSGMCQASIVFESLIAGASDYITKPFSEQRLMEAITRTTEENISYNRASIMLLSNNLYSRKWENTARFKRLTQEEIDILLMLLNRDGAESPAVDDFFVNMNYSPDTPEPLEPQVSLRDSKVGFPVLKAIHSYIDNFSSRAAPDFGEESKPGMPVSVYCIENSMNWDTNLMMNDTSIFGVIKYHSDSIPVTLFFPQVPDKDTRDLLIQYLYEMLLPLLSGISGSTELSTVSAREYFTSYGTAYAQVYVALLIKDKDALNSVAGIGIPHELAKSNLFHENLTK